uniref:sensor domain-containing diguanylate cyclase n=1 Tax=Thaumasiovibrio occultus TaxID=1891184 RepID=UPI00131D835C|nr:GGDEF domain-containing protein [Thaumasiovibrio occultus]
MKSKKAKDVSPLESQVSLEELLESVFPLVEQNEVHKSELILQQYEARCSYPQHLEQTLSAYLQLYFIYTQNGQYNHALDKLNKIVDLSCQYGMVNYYAEAILGMGNLCEMYDYPERALKFYERVTAIEPLIQSDDIRLLSKLHILSCLIRLNRTRAAKNLLAVCQEMAHKSQRPIHFNSLLYYQAILSRLDGKKRDALISLSQISMQAITFDSIWLYLESKREVAICLMETGRPELAEVIMRSCVKYARWNGDNHTIRRMLNSLSDVMMATGNYEQALEIEKEAHPLDLTIMTRIPMSELGGFSLRRLGRAEIKLKLAISEKKNAQLEAQTARQKHEMAELRKEALHDPLTSLLNRRWMEQEFAPSLHEHNAISAVIIDIDHFKVVNDSFSHLTGDNVLRQIATLLLKQFKQYHCCRLGGEEFLILMPETTQRTALKISETCREQIARFPWQHIVPTNSITVSIGVTTISNPSSINQLIDNADVALYRAKQNGRNRVEFEAPTAEKALTQ